MGLGQFRQHLPARTEHNQGAITQHHQLVQGVEHTGAVGNNEQCATGQLELDDGLGQSALAYIVQLELGSSKTINCGRRYTARASPIR